MKISAAVACTPGGDFEIQTVDLENPRPDEIRVRIAAVGVCHTDIVARNGGMPLSLPAVLGHEGAGTVDAVGSHVSKFKPDDRVVLTFRSCGTCSRCQSGDPAYCSTMPSLNYIGSRPDGSTAIQGDRPHISSNFFGQSSFATFALAYETNVVKIPDDLPFELAAPLGCGIQTGAGGVMLALAAEHGSTLLITGAGAVGLSAVMGGVIRGCRSIIVVEPHKARRDLATELGATHVIDPRANGDMAGMVRAIIPNGVDYAFDTTGGSEILSSVMACLAPKGICGIVGVPPAGAPVPGNLLTLLTYGHTVRGIIEGDSEPKFFIPRLIELWREGRLPLEKLIKTFPFSEINRAVESQHRGDCVKVVLVL